MRYLNYGRRPYGLGLAVLYMLPLGFGLGFVSSLPTLQTFAHSFRADAGRIPQISAAVQWRRPNQKLSVKRGKI